MVRASRDNRIPAAAILMRRISGIVTLEASDLVGVSKKLRCLLQRSNLKGCFGKTKNFLREVSYPSPSGETPDRT
jgi:hypothetical protein